MSFPGKAWTERPGEARTKRPGKARTKRPGEARTERPGKARTKRVHGLRHRPKLHRQSIEDISPITGDIVADFVMEVLELKIRIGALTRSRYQPWNWGVERRSPMYPLFLQASCLTPWPLWIPAPLFPALYHRLGVIYDAVRNPFSQ